MAARKSVQLNRTRSLLLGFYVDKSRPVMAYKSHGPKKSFSGRNWSLTNFVLMGTICKSSFLAHKSYNVKLQTWCSCNCFPKFLKFCTLLIFILPKIVWIHELYFFFPLLQVWIFLRSIVFMLFGKLLVSANALVVEFKVRSEKVALWSMISFFDISFAAVLEVNQTFSSLPSRKYFGT